MTTRTPHELSALMNELETFWVDHESEILEDLDRLIRIESIEARDHASLGAPFGPGPARALDEFLAQAKRAGAVVSNHEGYVGTADFVGESSTQVGIIGHVDIVPIGQGWSVPPLALSLRDNYVLGRGTSDDKGPFLMALWAARFWMHRHQTFPYTLRFIVGTNEETGMKDVEWYKQHFDDPAVLFTPDDEFPVCYGEKGQIKGFFTTDSIASGVLDIQGGMAINAVPGSAQALVDASCDQLKEELKELPAGIYVHAEGQRTRIIADGIQAHAALPEHGASAIALLASVLSELSVCSSEEKRFFRWLSDIQTDFLGTHLGIATKDDAFGDLTCVASMISLNQGAFTQTIDIRYPTSTSSEALEVQLREAAVSIRASWHTSDAEPVFMVDPESSFVQALAQSYRDVTGDMQPLFTIGGGTYARHFNCAVGFGALVRGTKNPSWVGGMHAADEGVALADLKRAFQVYAVAIDRLMALEL